MELRRVSQPDTMSNLHYYSACRLCLEPRSPALPADSSPPESPGKPKNTAVGSLSLLQGILPAQESNWGLLHGRWILYQLSYQGSPCMPIYIYIHIHKYIYIYISCLCCSCEILLYRHDKYTTYIHFLYSKNIKLH